MDFFFFLFSFFLPLLRLLFTLAIIIGTGNPSWLMSRDLWLLHQTILILSTYHHDIRTSYRSELWINRVHFLLNQRFQIWPNNWNKRHLFGKFILDHKSGMFIYFEMNDSLIEWFLTSIFSCSWFNVRNWICGQIATSKQYPNLTNGLQEAAFRTREVALA